MNEHATSEIKLRHQKSVNDADGLWSIVEAQLSTWRLTSAERDVAICLLLGLSNKQIARRRKTTERTVRAQAHAIYAKTELDGRHRLTGFFFNTMLNGAR